MSKRRILYVVNEDFYFHNHRLAHAIALQEAGFELHVACRETSFRPAIESMGITFHPIEIERSLGTRILAERRCLIHIVKKVQADMLHAVGLKSIMISVSLLVINWRLRAVLAISGIGLACVKPNFIFRASFLLLRIALVNTRCHLLTQNSSDRHLIDPSGNNSTLIPGVGINTTTFRSDVPQIDEDEPIRLVYLGRAIRSKGLPDLVAALEGFEGRFSLDAYFLQDDRSPGRLTPADIEQIKRSPMVNVHPPVSSPETALLQAHVAVLPSLGGEGVSKFSLEAMAMSRPLIASRTPGNEDVVVSGENGLLFEPGNILDLRRALETMYTMRHEIPRMGSAARSKAIEKYSLDVILPRIVKLHRDILP